MRTREVGRVAAIAAPPWILVLVDLARHAAIVGIAGVGTGVLIGGLGGRVVMRISAIAAPSFVTGASTEGGNIVGDITVGGTLALIVFVGILAGLVGAVSYLITEPWLAWAGRWHGLVFGGFLLATGSTVAFEPGNRDFLILGRQELNVAMFAALFVGYGLLIRPMIRTIDHRLPVTDPNRPIRHGWGYLLLAAFGLQFLALFFAQFFSADASGSDDPPVLLGLVVVGLTLATATWYGVRLAGRRGPPPVITVGGYVLVGLAAGLGITRALRDIGEIIRL